MQGLLIAKMLQLAFAELGSTTGCFEAVLFALFHAGVTGEEASLLEGGTKLFVCLEKGAADAVTDRASLTGSAAAVYVDEYVKLVFQTYYVQGGTYYHLQRFKAAEVIVDIPLVDEDLAIAGEKTHAGYAALSPTGSNILNLCHFARLLR